MFTIHQTKDIHRSSIQWPQQTAGNQPLWQVGDILQGTVLGHQQQKIQIQIQDTEIQTTWTEGALPDIGTVLSFQVEKTSTDSYTLRLLKNQENIKKQPAQGLNQLYTKAGQPKTGTNALENPKGIDKEEAKELQYIQQNFTEEDEKKLRESGLDPEKMTPEELSQWLKNQGHKKGNPPSIEELEKWVQHLTQERKLQTPMDILKQAIDILLKEGLPITIRNVQGLLSMGQKLETISEMPAEKLAHLIQNNQEPTIDEWYQSYYTGDSKIPTWKAENPYEKWEETKNIDNPEAIARDNQWIQQEISRIFQRENIESTIENQETGISLIQAGTPITKENVNILQRYQQYQEDIKSNPRPYLEAGAKQLAKGESLGDITLEAKSVANHSQEQEIPSLKTIQEKRQRAEIQLQMTVEANQKHGEKHSIDIGTLQDQVEELRVLEKEILSMYLKQAGVDPTEEALTTMVTVEEHRQKIDHSQIPLMGDILATETDLDLLQLQVLGEKANHYYEEIGTKPERRFGETLDKVEDQIAYLLEQNGIEPTPAQQRAAYILVQNQLPITEENLMEVKLLDQKIQTLIQGLHPVLVANMMKDKINPMESTIEEIQQYLDQFEEWKGIDAKAKLTQHILDLDQEKILSPKQREGVIGLYRMLHTIEGSEGGAVGHLYKNNLPLTLGNLMKSAMYLERYEGVGKSKIDIEISELTGFLEEVKENERSIQGQIEKGFQEDFVEKTTKWEEKLQKYETRLLQKLIKELSPQKAEELIQQEQWEEIKVEDILIKDTMVEESIEQGAEPISIVVSDEKIKASAQAILTHYEIEPTIKNLKTMTQMVQDPFCIGETMEELNQLTQQLLQTEIILPALQEQIQTGTQGLQEQIHKLQKEALTLPKKQRQQWWKTSQKAEDMLRLQEQIQNKDNLYQIPMGIHDRISQLNIYIIKDEENQKQSQENDDVKAWLSLDTTTLGPIGMYLHIDDKKVDIQVYAEDPESLAYLRTQSPRLQQSIKQIGYQIGPLLYGQQKVKQPLVETADPHLQFRQRRVGNGAFEVVG